MTQPDKPQPEGPLDAGALAREIAAMLRRLEPGPLAVLRRMDDTGAPAFWRLAAAHPAIGRNTDTWRAITRMLAILTPKGRPEDRPAVQHRIPLGRALCDGGDPFWRPRDLAAPDGVVSERRLAAFLATRGAARGVALERLARALARSLPADCQVNPADLAFALLAPTDPENRIARDYYTRLDSRFADKEAQDD